MERSVNMRQLALPVIAGLTVTSAVAQTTPPANSETNRMTEVVITATKIAQPIEQTAAAVSIISRADIEEKKFSNLAEALEDIPSLSVVRNGTPGQVTSVFLRGTESNHTLLTVDGRRLPSNLAGGFYYENLTLDNVDRIEVVRSPSSSIYGGDAIGGVINVITRTGRGLQKPEHEVSFEGGSFHTFRESASSRGAIGKFDYSVGLSHSNAEYPRENNDFRLSTLRSSLGYEATDDMYFDLKTSYLQSYGGSPNTVGFPSLGAKLKREAVNISPGVTWDYSEMLQSKLYYSYDHQFQPSKDPSFPAPFAINRLTIDANRVEWQNNLHPAENWHIVAGFDYQDTHAERTSDGVKNIDENLSSFGLYAQNQWSPLDRVWIQNSIRYDMFSDYNNAVTWRQGVSWRVPTVDTLLYGNVSRSFSPPTIQDLYFPFSGNPNLKPERALSWEIGADQDFAEGKFGASLVWFQNNYKDFIELNPAFFPVNVPEATTEGVETAFRWVPCDKFSARFSYTYTTATDDFDNRRLIRRPRHQVKGDIRVEPIEQVVVTAGLSRNMDREEAAFPAPFFTRTNLDSEDYLTVRAAVTWQVNEHLELWVKGENLNDDQYQQVAGFPALRAAAYGGMRVKF